MSAVVTRALCCSVALAAGAVAQPLVGRISSADTAIVVEAGEHAPRLTQLALRASSARWMNRAAEQPPSEVRMNGATRTVTWRLDRSASRVEQNRIEFVYVADALPIRLSWRWQARSSSGPLEHAIFIQNLGSQPIELGLQPSLRFDWRIERTSALSRLWLEKGADSPSADGTHLDALNDGDSWEGRSSTYARPEPEMPREMIPYILVEESAGAQQGWYLGVEFSGRTRISMSRRADSLRGEAGLDPSPGPYRTRILPGGRFATPSVFLGAFQGGPDAAGNLLKRWVRVALGNERALADASYPLTVNNSWGSGMAVDEALAQRMIADSADLGLEMFHLDAGWFRDVGDWHADPAKFPHGIASVAEFAHRHGLKFGLWIDWTQAGTSRGQGARNLEDPAIRDWLIADPPAGWKHTEPFKGITMDLGAPAVAAWAAQELERVVSEYHLDMLEHDGYLVAQGSARSDHLAIAPDPASLRVYADSGYVWVDSSNATDVSYHATRAYYEIYRGLRERHPALLLEICNDGGRMMDFGSAAHGDYFSITDTYDPLSNRRAFYDASYVFPPAMLESYVEKWPAPGLENFRYALRSGMLGWFSLMQDAGQWSDAQREAARREIALYKSELRPLIRGADLYHVGPRPDGVHWDGIEYYAAARRRGVLYAFRGSAPEERAHRFRLLGLDPARRYRLRFQDAGPAAGLVASGRALMQSGVAVSLPLPLSSELIFFEAVP